MTAFNDLRYALRQLLRRPGFLAAVVLTLALGIGANAAIFSMINGLMLKPLPYPQGERLVAVYNTYPLMGLPNAGVSIPDYLDRRDRAEAFEATAMYTWNGMNLTGQGRPERLLALRATPSLFEVLSVPPAMGRTPGPEHAEPGNDRVAVLSHGLWQQLFGGREDVLGRRLQLNGQSYEVIGVMPAGFVFPNQDVRLWIPFAFTPEQMSDQERGTEYSNMIARLRPGASVEQAQSQVDRIHEINREAAPAEVAEFWTNSGFGGRVVDYRSELIGELRGPLMLLQIAVALVLLIACANVANLMLARVNSRQRELAVRSALGAGRKRIVRQLLVESLLLALCGAIGGLAVAHFGLELLLWAGLGSSNALFEIDLDTTVLLFALAVALLTGLLFGVAPALAAARASTSEVLKEGGRGAGGSRSSQRVRSALVIAQVAVAATLLIGAGLLIRSFLAVQSESPGFTQEGLLTARLSLPDDPYGDPATARNLRRALIERIGALPGVEHVGVTSALPFSGNSSQASYSIEGYEPPPGESQPHGSIRLVDGGFFRAMQISVLEGRVFEESDDPEVPLAVVDELLAQRYFPDGTAIGQRIGLSTEQGQRWFTIIGVVAPVRHGGLDEQPSKETYYLPFGTRAVSSPSLVLRSSLAPSALVDPLRAAIHEIDPNLPLTRIQAMEELIDVSLQTRRAPMLLLVVFAGVALVLSAVGIYGVLAYSVSQRTGELGVRMALGAQIGDVLRLVLRQGGRLVAIGLAIGITLALLLSGLIAAQLHGVSRFDPAVMGLVVVFLGAVALIACLLPAWRASRVDPIEALRQE
ncbi:ABC transporter permease [Wenzhouxiangella marina]|uniref:Permease n=1 Tax=Wenzhouxiangella marina TaxID=1579979 RepID=A0A0K0XS37_9GAMM|nr:ABC transporter permease [Wenzhouxiangella marina]AKS40524.1 Permease [Wenzhouxiangella marina]MBB6088152.1 putative permease [Wenzhouxiangella marina]